MKEQFNEWTAKVAKLREEHDALKKAAHHYDLLHKDIQTMAESYVKQLRNGMRDKERELKEKISGLDVLITWEDMGYELPVYFQFEHPIMKRLITMELEVVFKDEARPCHFKYDDQRSACKLIVPATTKQQRLERDINDAGLFLIYRSYHMLLLT